MPHIAIKKRIMATIQTNSIASGLRGSLGNLVFRQVHGKTIVSGKRDGKKKQSELQRENRSRFQSAAYWAKSQMLDPEKKAYYWRKAKKLKLPNAYTAAVSDYMRKADIKDVDIKQYKGNAGDVVKLNISKKDYAVHKVDVVVFNEEGNVIESGVAMKNDNCFFIYKATMTIPENTAVRIRVAVNDHTWNTTKKEVAVISQKKSL
jgi:hypothetical protein